ncbi:MAG: tol-pal system protein YbgF [Magnetococcales bacterium]|nr:tol-pal system protein YbgF [Magnetococcales bacterium]
MVIRDLILSKRPALALLCAFLAAGCVTLPNKSNNRQKPAPLENRADEPNTVSDTSINDDNQDRLNQAIEALHKSNKSLQATLSGMEQRLILLESDISTLRGEFDTYSHGRAIRNPSADGNAQAPMGDDQQQFALLEPNVDGLPQEPGSELMPSDGLQQPQPDSGTLSENMQASNPQPVNANMATPPTGMEIAGGPPVQIDSNKSPKEAYDDAMLLLQSGQYDKALAGFSYFLQANPDDELSDNAQYWLGEVHYVQGQFREALMAFNQVLVRWPVSDKVPGSLLKIGFSFIQLEDYDNARLSLERIVSDYPGSSAVTPAKQRLKTLPIPPSATTVVPPENSADEQEQ